MPDLGHQRLIRRLAALSELPSAAAETLGSLPFSYAEFAPHDAIYAPGAALDHYLVCVDGSVCRYKVAASGAQAIISFEFPGDLLNVDNLSLDKSDCGARAMSHVRIALISRPALDAARHASRDLDAALQRYAMVRAATAEEWLLNVGRRPARERIAHLICEMVARAAAVDIPWQDVSPLLPETFDTAGATGLTVVQVTRALRDLVAEGAISAAGESIAVLSINRLKELGRFNPGYLHLVEA